MDLSNATKAVAISCAAIGYLGAAAELLLRHFWSPLAERETRVLLDILVLCSALLGGTSLVLLGVVEKDCWSTRFYLSLTALGLVTHNAAHHWWAKYCTGPNGVAS